MELTGGGATIKFSTCCISQCITCSTPCHTCLVRTSSDQHRTDQSLGPSCRALQARDNSILLYLPRSLTVPSPIELEPDPTGINTVPVLHTEVTCLPSLPPWLQGDSSPHRRSHTPGCCSPGRTSRPPPGTEGPSCLPPHVTLSGLWQGGRGPP